MQLTAYVVAGALVIVASASSCSEQPPRVVLGGTGGLPSLAAPSATRTFRELPGTGFYIHYSATDPKLFSTTLKAVSAIFADKPSVSEVSLGGGFNPQFWTTAWKTNVVAYGFAPHITVVNVDIAQSNAASGAANTEVQEFSAFVRAGRLNAGLAIFAPVVSPNSSGGAGSGGDAKTLAIMHPWSDPWWDSLRAMAQNGGGVAFDAPPAFFLHGLADQVQNTAYQAFTIAGIRWAIDHHLWSGYIVSPYFDASSFKGDSEKVYAALQDAQALPDTWIVENYNECGPPYPRQCTKSDAAFLALIGQEDVPNTEASVALWLAQKSAGERDPKVRRRAD